MNCLIKIICIGVVIIVSIFIFDISFAEEIVNETDSESKKEESFIEKFKNLKKNNWFFWIKIFIKLLFFLDLTNFTIIKTLENLAIYFDFKLNTDKESKDNLNEVIAEFYYNRDPNANVKIWTWKELFKYIISLIILLI